MYRWPTASIDFATAGQVLIITPFTLAGAMAPVTIAGALTLAHAEALAGLTLAQIVRPGAPIVYGSFTSNVDMKSGSPAFGTPEYVKAAFGAGQLARFLGLPWRSSNATASNIPDAQSAYESQMSLWGALFGGCNFVLHAARLAGERTDHLVREIHPRHRDAADVCRSVPTRGSGASGSCLEAVAEVGAGGHFFGCAHTMERYRSAFYAPLVSDWRNAGQWAEDGAKDGNRAGNRHLAERIEALCRARSRILPSSRRSTRSWRGARRKAVPRRSLEDVASGHVAVAISQVREAVAS